MAIATPADETRIFIDRTALLETMTMNTLERSLREEGINAEVFTMAGRVGIDFRTIDLMKVATLLKSTGLI
jgi:hypothetical protein